MNKRVCLQLGLLLLGCSGGFAVEKQRLPVDYVDPFIGTGGHGHTFPGAVVPHGMVQVSPDTRNDNWDACAGYHYSDSSIMGFSQTHFSGTGQSDLLDFLLMPGTGTIQLQPGTLEDPDSGYRSRFRHETEVAAPGYYKVDLDDYNIRAELTASPRVGVLRFTFPAAADAHVMLDMFHTFRKRKILAGDVAVVDNQLVTGYRNVKGWARDRKIYFAARFSKPFSKHALYDGDQQLKNAAELSSTEIRAAFFFNTKKDEEILVKIAVSSVSAENALRNLDQEVPHWDFDQVRRNARDLWSKELASIEAEADESTLRNFYTAMYHVAIHPTLYTDVNGEYRGLDNRIHRAEGWTNYTVFSLWDTFRALHPLMTLTDPDSVDDMVRSMMAHYEQSDRGMLPIWSFHHNDTDCMIGYHSVPVIADAYFKGLTSTDPKKMLAAMVSSATARDFRGMGLYMDKGYVPQDKERDATSKTLEYAYDDWCIAKMAEALGDQPQSDAFYKRSQNYRNVFDSETGFMRAKSNDGTWREPFDPFAYHHKGRKGKRTRDFTEGNAWQWNWFVPHDVQGLIGLHGGPAPFVAKLDEFFNPPSLATHKPARDATGLVGVYAQGNEPGHHAPYLFNYAGQPWKTQEILHRIMSEHFHDTPDGIPGNEDCGQMSAWYVFSALGFYPVNPCGGNYAIGRPALSKGQLELADGKRFVVTAANLSDENIYVQSVTFNGRNLDRVWLTHDEIIQGGTIAFVMGPKPNRKWAAGTKAGKATPPLAFASTGGHEQTKSVVKQDRGALKKNDRIVFLGDSITAAGAKPGGYVTLASETIAKSYPDLNIKLIGAGKGGHKVPNCQKRLDRDVLQKKPTIVYIYIGINDVWHWTHPKVVARGKKGTTPEDFESGLRDMIGKINDVGARVILCTPTVIGEKHDGTNPDDKKLDQYSDISRKVAKETGSQLLDLRKEIIAHLKLNNPQNLDKGILTEDTVHMNVAGNRFLAEQVLEALNVSVANTEI